MISADYKPPNESAYEQIHLFFYLLYIELGNPLLRPQSFCF